MENVRLQNGENGYSEREAVVSDTDSIQVREQVGEIEWRDFKKDEKDVVSTD